MYDGDSTVNRAKLAEWSATRRALGGGRGFAKHRTFPTYAEAAELGLKQRYDNPVTNALKGLELEERYNGFMRAVHVAKDEGLLYAKPVRTGLLEGEDFLRDSHGDPWHVPGVGTMAGDKNAVRILNNTVSGGIWEAPELGQAAYRAYMTAQNAMNAAHVGWSGFHFTFTNLSAAMREAGGAAAEGFGKLAHGDVPGATRALGRFAAAPARGIRDALEGGKALKALRSMSRDDPAFRELMEGLTMTGARVMHPETQQALQRGRLLGNTLQWDSWGKAVADSFKSEAWRGGAQEKFSAFTKVGSTPVMEFVRRAKIGAGLNMYAREIEAAMAKKGGALSIAEKRAIGHGIMENLNNVMGQIPRDQLYFSKGMKDWMGLVMAFPKWQLGSLRLAATGAISPAKAGLRFLGNKSLQALTPREKLGVQMATGMLMVHGLTMALMNRMMAGKYPWETDTPFKDMIAARSGYNDQNGNPQRLWLPDYFRTYTAIEGHPVRWVTNIAGPIASDAIHILSNMDYWGNQIFDPSLKAQGLEGYAKMAEQVLKHEGRQLMPFSVQSGTRMQQAMPGQNPALTVGASFMGVQPAPRDLTQTLAQNTADIIARSKYGSMNPEEQDKSAAKRRVADAYRAGQKPEQEDLDMLTGKQVKGMFTKGQLSPRRQFARTIERFSPDDLAKVYAAAKKDGDKADLNDIRALIAKRLMNARGKPLYGMSPVDYKQFMPVMMEALKPDEEPKSEETVR